MTNSQSKLAHEDNVGNRLAFLSDVLYKVINDRDVIRQIFSSLDDLESIEERTYHKVVYNLEDQKKNPRNRLPANIKCGIHLFRENYLQPKFYDKSYTVSEKIMLAKKIEKYRGWQHGRPFVGVNKWCISELKRIRDSIEWRESYQSKCNYQLGGCILMVKDKNVKHHRDWIFKRANQWTLSRGGTWTLGLKPGHTGKLIIEFIRSDRLGSMMDVLAWNYEMYSMGCWYNPMPLRNKIEDYFVYLEDHPRNAKYITSYGFS